MLRRRARLVFGYAAAMLVLALGASAGAATLPGGSRNESFQAWFVQFKTPPVAKGGSKAALASERAAFFKNAADQGLSVTQRRAFDDLWNGVSVNVPAAQAGALAKIPGVTAVYPVVALSLPPSAEAGTADPDLRYATTMTGADIAQNELGFSGAGVKVAIMDSGLDYTLPEFGSCSAVGGSCRVAGGWDFVGDDYDANSANSTYQPIPHPDADPAPCDPNVADARALQPGAGPSAAAHGTHVAGIVGADGRSDPANLVTGVAPGATLYAYRVFGCNGSTDADIMAAAMERAAADHVHVLNMSIGSAFANFPNYPTAVAADNLAGTGTTVVASIGNSGESGLFSAGAPGVGNKVIGVASVDNIKTFLRYFLASPDNKHMGFNSAAGAPEPPTSGTFPLARIHPNSTKTTNGDGCGDFTPAANSLNGKIALVRRGSAAAPAPTCTFYLKAFNAQQAGAIGVVIYNNVPGRVNPTVAPPPGSPPVTIPVVTVTATDGATLWDRIAAGDTTLTWTDQSEYVDNVDTPGRTSSFSSWGTTSDLQMKPDITAPGGNIRSTWPHQQHEGHWVISGTSMASPHVAGAVALYLQGHAGATPAAVRAGLQNSAKPVQFQTFALFRDSTARQGAGMLDIAAAVQEKTGLTPSKISLGDQSPITTTLTLTNGRATPVTYNLSSPADTIAPGPSSNPANVYPFAVALFVPANSVTFSSPSVVVPAGGQATVDVTISPDAGLPAKSLYGGYVIFTNAATPSEKLRVPYLGFKGDYQSLPVITAGGCALPMLARFGSDTDKINCDAGVAPIEGLIGQPAGGVWERPKQDPVVLLYHFNHQSANYTLTLLNAATEQPVTVGGRIPIVESVDLVPRNSGATTFFGSVWDGTLAFTTGNGKTQRKAAPGGVYKLRLTITKVKAFNDSRPAGTESWTSPAFTLRDG